MLLRWIFSRHSPLLHCGFHLRMDLASNEQNKSHITAELLKKELQLATDEEKFLNVCSSRDLEQDLSNLQRELDEIFKTKGKWSQTGRVVASLDLAISFTWDLFSYYCLHPPTKRILQLCDIRSSGRCSMNVYILSCCQKLSSQLMHASFCRGSQSFERK